MLIHERALPLVDDPRAVVRVPVRLVVSVAFGLLALVMIELLEPALGFPGMFPALVAVIFISAELGGAPYGLVTLATFGVGYARMLQEPRLAFALEAKAVTPSLVTYTASGLVVVFMGGALRKAHLRLRAQHRAVIAAREQQEDLLRALAHDVRVPLTTITLNASRLVRHPVDPSAARLRGQAIERGAASINAMLSDLVELAKLESGHLPQQRKPVDVAGFAAELKARLQGTLQVERVELAVPEQLAAVRVDPHSLERILVNLLSNALKYAPAPTPVVLGASQQRSEVVLSISDTGPGISPDDLPHIFEKHFRAAGTRHKDGLGIGLHATRLFVQLNRGRIWVTSAVGTGTTFFVAFPAGERPATARAPAPSRASTTTVRPRTVAGLHWAGGGRLPGAR